MIAASHKNLNQLLSQIKSSAAKRGIPCSITVADLGELSFPISCPCLKFPLTFNTGHPKDNSYSVDRIDSTKGYEPGNLVIISFRANVLKSNASIHEMKQIVNYFESFH